MVLDSALQNYKENHPYFGPKTGAKKFRSNLNIGLKGMADMKHAPYLLYI